MIEAMRVHVNTDWKKEYEEPNRMKNYQLAILAFKDPSAKSKAL